MNQKEIEASEVAERLKWAAAEVIRMRIDENREWRWP